MRHQITRDGSRGSAIRRVGTIAALTFAMAGLAACDGLMDVELPGDLTEEAVFEPAQAEIIGNSIIANYETGFTRIQGAYTGMESVFHRTSGFFGNFAEYNETRLSSGRGHTFWWSDFQSTRWMASELYDLLENEWTEEQVPNRDELMMVSATFAGLAVQFIGETVCESTFDTGPLQTQAQALERAEEWFTTALSLPGDHEITNTSSLRQLAHLGRARVRLALGTRYAEPSEQAGYLQGAAEDAAAVEPGFEAWATRDNSGSRRWNQFRYQHHDLRYGSIQDYVVDPVTDEIVPFTGYRNLTIDDQGRSVVNRIPVKDDGVVDPRVPTYNREITSFDGESIVWGQTKYEAVGDNERMGSWEEAQLILAELEGGQSAVSRINAIRDLYEDANLPDFSSTDEQEIQDHVIEERRRTLFLESGTRHWVDKLRYQDDWGWFPEPGTPAVPDNYAYGAATCVLMPLSEYEANPNAEGDGSQHLF